jgi:cell division protein FtsN
LPLILIKTIKAMKLIVFLLVGSLLLTGSCATANKRLKDKTTQNPESHIPGTTVKRTLMPAGPIREVEEKLVPNNEKAPDTHKYFVVVGSFRSYANAKKRQTAVTQKGFTSEILKNEAGLYRVSVKATDNAEEAREEVRRIWAKFPEYADTWMLVQIK